jgi:hypothetical protein
MNPLAKFGSLTPPTVAYFQLAKTISYPTFKRLPFSTPCVPIQPLHKASALNEIELVSGTGGAAIVNRAGGQAAQTETIGSVPTRFALHQNYPNPFNPTTVIRYELPSNAVVKVQVFDVLGRVLATLVNERREAGIYEAMFNASGLSSGTYFYRLQAGSFVETKKMVLVK